MTAKGLDREEGIREAVLFGLISKQDFHVVNSRPAPAPGPSVPDKSIPDLKKNRGLGKWRVALSLALQPQRGVATPAPWQGASPGSPQEELRLHIMCHAAGLHPAGYRPVLLVPEHLTPGTPAGTEMSMGAAGVGGEPRGMQRRLPR